MPCGRGGLAGAPGDTQPLPVPCPCPQMGPVRAELGVAGLLTKTIQSNILELKYCLSIAKVLLLHSFFWNPNNDMMRLLPRVDRAVCS